MICSNCGSRLNSTDNKCRHCGEEKPSAEELEKMIKKTFDKADHLKASSLDRVMKWIFFASAPVFITLSVLFSEEKIIILYIFPAGLSVFAGILAGYPKLIWEMEKLRMAGKIYTEGLEPTDKWSIGRKISYWVFYGLAIFLFFVVLYVTHMA